MDNYCQVRIALKWCLISEIINTFIPNKSPLNVSDFEIPTSKLQNLQTVKEVSATFSSHQIKEKGHK